MVPTLVGGLCISARKKDVHQKMTKKMARSSFASLFVAHNDQKDGALELRAILLLMGEIERAILFCPAILIMRDLVGQ